MLMELVLGSVLAVATLAVLEISPVPPSLSRRWTEVAILRQAMRGEDAAALRAEFRRSGILPPERVRFGDYL